MVTGEDVKDLRKLVKMLEVANFERLTPPQIYTVFLQFQKLGDFISRLEKHVNSPEISATPVTPVLKKNGSKK